jgi:Uma2 family endonuclease
MSTLDTAWDFAEAAAFVPPLRRWTRTEYERLADLGMFAGQRVELVEGEIRVMAAQKNAHVVAVALVEEALRAAFGPGFWVRVQAPLTLSSISAPEPDLAVVPGTARDYTAHPTGALLVVEVADATLLYDQRQKSGVYAAAGIADYWIVDLVNRRLVVHRQAAPSAAEPAEIRYQRVATFAADQSVTPLAAPHAAISVADLLP